MAAVQAIFRMNQKQLEVAMRRVWNDSSLEAKRKAYLMQHIMASRQVPALVPVLCQPPTCWPLLTGRCSLEAPLPGTGSC